MAARPRAAVLYGRVREVRGREVGEKDFTRSPKRQRRLGHGRRRRDRAGGGRRSASGGSISKGLGESGVDVRLEGSEERLVCARGESGILAQRGLQQPVEGARRLGDDGVVAPQELDDERVLGAMRRELATVHDWGFCGWRCPDAEIRVWAEVEREGYVYKVEYEEHQERRQ